MTLEQINARIAELAGTHRSIINEAIKIEGGMAELRSIVMQMEAAAQIAPNVPQEPSR